MGEREQLGRLFEQAIALPPEERADFLDRHAGRDPGLRGELASLLASHDTAPGFLEAIAPHVLPAALRALAEETLPAGHRVGRYDIIERVGGGGMGVVYKARDTSLDRLVALKFLPAHRTAQPEARDRLMREARAASALDHPGIAVVHEIGVMDPDADDPDHGRLFIAMAYYDGETLERRLRRGPLPVRQALDHAIQLVDGLAAAHQAGIVHRDVKPGNVLVTERGRLKILDFGVARRADGGRAEPADARGTLPYMSPEQTRGESADQRTDLWSVGVVLFELLAGVRPFQGDTEADLVSAIQGDAPPPLQTLRPDVPPALARVVDRCLVRDPAHRYPDARALLSDLRAAAAAGTGEGGPSIVVLPFTNIGPDAGDEYLSDGMTEEVIARLSRVRSLRVISRTSAMRLKGRGDDVGSLARELGVRYVLEGAVRRAGDGVRITARLLDAPGDTAVWADVFDGPTDTILDMQEQVARAVVAALHVRLSPAEAGALADRPIPDAHAYESYLRARYEAWRFSRDGLDRARRYIETALSIVGDNELLYSTLGHVTAMHLEAGVGPGEGALERIDELADRVFALDAASPRGHWLRGFAAFQRGDLRGAMAAGERAYAREPDDPDTLLLLGYVYAHAGRNGEARALLERAVELDPLTPLTRCMPGFVSLLEGRFEEAVEPYRSMYAMDPESPFAAVTFGWVLAYARRFDEALDVLDGAAARFPGTAFASWAEALAHALRGQPDDAVGAITPAFEAAAQRSEMFARALAHCYALAGDRPRAFRWLEREVELGMLNHRFLAEHDWFLQDLREEPAFAALLDRVRDAAAGLAAGEPAR
jgi:eukaryotic-like serine/threonine-protein kinase